MAKKKNAARPSAKRTILEKELTKLLPRIDAEGLAFLIRQSHTIIHNLQVDELNQALAKADRAERKTSAPARRDGAVNEDSAEGESVVRIEDAPGGSSFIVVLGATRKIFSRVELRKLVALVTGGAGDDAARSEQLYLWLKKHRGDVLFDGRIESRTHPLLVRLARYLRTHYHVRN